MKMLSQKTLQLIDDAMRSLDFELKTGNKVNISIGPKVFDMELFARKHQIYVNDQPVGEIIEEIDPFV